MNSIKKKVAAGLLTASFALVAGSMVTAAEYPAKPIMAIIPFPAGGGTDLMGRAAAKEMSELFGHNVVVDNRAGGAGTVGLGAIARARNDGYTIGIVPAAPLVNQPHMSDTPYDLDSFEYICKLFFSPQTIAIAPNSRFNSLDELVEYARENPGELTYGSPGPGTLMHIATEQFLQLAGIEIEHLPFTGEGPAATALMGGHIDMLMGTTGVMVEREFNAVVVFSEEPVDSLPDVPTGRSLGYDMVSSWWGGVIAPAGIPEEAKARRVEGCESAGAAEAYQRTIERLGALVRFRGPDDLRTLVHEEHETSGPIIKAVLDGAGD
ncbi:MAG: tripartite tricarboxylate transporter substrate binding protein [Ectothiorhodospiraceae bacterium]|nr:tripartite tricarboxylate transporter substrate binding protein [Ectothiorhodospiraceae bacterium]